MLLIAVEQPSCNNTNKQELKKKTNKKTKTKNKNKKQKTKQKTKQKQKKTKQKKQCGMVFRLIAPFPTECDMSKVRRSDFKPLGRKSGLKVTKNIKKK